MNLLQSQFCVHPPKPHQGCFGPTVELSLRMVKMLDHLQLVVYPNVPPSQLLTSVHPQSGCRLGGGLRAPYTSPLNITPPKGRSLEIGPRNQHLKPPKWEIQGALAQQPARFPRTAQPEPPAQPPDFSRRRRRAAVAGGEHHDGAFGRHERREAAQKLGQG